MKVVAIVQARMGSTRFPGKVMKPIGEVPMIELLLSRLSRAKEVDQIVVATSVDQANQPLMEHVEQLGYRCVRGSETDVLGRYLEAARQSCADIVVRITGDCPLIDPALVDVAVTEFRQQDVDYLSNTSPPTYPDGLDTEVFTVAALERAEHESAVKSDREHVTPFLRRSGLFNTVGTTHTQDLSDFRWTVDELADFEVVSNVFRHFAPDIHFS